MDMQINIQIPPQGDATPDDVLETKTFTSKGSYAKKKGKIRVIGGFQSPTAVRVDPSGTVFMKATKAYYDGEGQVYSPIENLVAGNVKKGVKIGEMTGTYEGGGGGGGTGGNAQPYEVAGGKTFTNDDGVQVGTLVTRDDPDDTIGLIPVGKQSHTDSTTLLFAHDTGDGRNIIVEGETTFMINATNLAPKNIKKGVKVLDVTGTYEEAAKTPPFIYGLWGNITKSTDTIREWTFFVDNVLFEPERIFVEVNSDGSMRAKNPNSNNIILELINPFLMGLNGSDGENAESATTAGSNQYDWTTIWSTILEMEYIPASKRLRFVVRAGIMSYGNAAKFEGNYPTLYVDRLQLLS